MAQKLIVTVVLPDAYEQRKLKPPTPRTNPFPKAKDVFCRLHLRTFLYRSEAENFGDLMHAVMDTNKGVNKSVLSLVSRS